MNYYISTDSNYKVGTIDNVPHKKENWESPVMDKFNNAAEYLDSINSNAKLECHFNSSTQLFIPKYELCIGLSKAEVDDLIKTINNL